jgi:hypothetical protein
MSCDTTTATICKSCKERCKGARNSSAAKITEEVTAGINLVNDHYMNNGDCAASFALSRTRRYVLSRYPVLKIHSTITRHAARNTVVMARLTPTLTSAIP